MRGDYLAADKELAWETMRTHQDHERGEAALQALDRIFDLIDELRRTRKERMSVRTTDEKAVALYDSATGIAFGPVFTSEGDADAFLSWLPNDARVLTAKELAAKFKEFVELNQ